MTKLHLDPNSPRTNFVLGAALTGGDVTKAAELAAGARLIAIGVTPHRLIREEDLAAEACTTTLVLEPGQPLKGHGATPRAAAKHLAEQLREIARLIVASEGSL